MNYFIVGKVSTAFFPMSKTASLNSAGGSLLQLNLKNMNEM